MLPARFQVEALRSSSLAGEETDKNQEKKITTHMISGLGKLPVLAVVVGLRSLPGLVQSHQLLSVQLVGRIF